MHAARPFRSLLAAVIATSAVAASVALTPGAAAQSAGQAATIAQIQGEGHRSPLENAAVKGVAGVVTATNDTGFWMQSTRPDRDSATSEGVYVYTKTAPEVTVRDQVRVAGKVSEFRPGGEDGGGNLTTTQIVDPVITTTAEQQRLPRAVVLGKDRVAPAQQVKAGNPRDVERPSARFAPARNALDFYESLEGMRTGLHHAVATAPTNTSYGELPVVPGQRVKAVRTRAGGVVYGGYDQPNAMRVILDDPLLPKDSLPAANVGDVLPGSTVGVLDYAFGNFKLLLTETPRHRAAGPERESTKPQSRRQLAVATFNVENLSPADPATKFERLARQVTTNLRNPDVLALEEIQDDSGPTDDGKTSSKATVGQLVSAIKAAGGPTYEARWIDPEDKQDGGQPGGNIRTAFLYRADRGVQFVDREGGDATTATKVVGSGRHTALSASPGRIAPTDEAWRESRKPLAGEFRFRGQTYFVIANHFASKGGDDSLFGRWQQPERSSEPQRHQQARVVRGFVDQLLAADRRANVLVVGDLNDFEFSRTADILVGKGRTRLTDLPRTLPAHERSTYIFDGNSQVLDHILISHNLASSHGWPGRGVDYDIVHTNSQYHDQDSDHDPQIVRLRARGY